MNYSGEKSYYRVLYYKLLQYIAIVTYLLLIETFFITNIEVGAI